MWRILIVLGMLGLCINTAAALSGSGTEAEPWRIETLEDFNEFAGDENYWAGFTRLETDVNLAGLIYTTAVIAPDTDNSNDRFDGRAFIGVFDGNDHKIINLTIDDSGVGNAYLGLFGFIDGIFSGGIKNLGLEGGSISGDDVIGGLVGENYDYAYISNCYSTVSVSGDYYVGGLVGRNWYSSVSNCYYRGDVSGTLEVGGIVGRNWYGSVSSCYSTGDVSGTEWLVGGLVGRDNQGSVLDCYSTGDVSGNYIVGGLVGDNFILSNSYFAGSVSGNECVGGLAGVNYGTVLNCYSIGDVNGVGYVGGLVGINYLGSALNCYSTGDVNGVEDVGGLVGYNDQGSVSNCFWDTDTQIHGVTESFGDNEGTVSNIFGLPTAQMQTGSTFTDAGWDFEEIWDIGEKQTYPYLRQYLSADLNHDGRVNMADFAILAGHWLEGASG